MPGALPRAYQPTPLHPTAKTSAQAVGARALGFFLEKGLTNAQAAGIVGNLQQESSLNPSDSGGFLAQWLGSRLTALQSFAASKHAAVAGDPEVQLEFIWQELNTTQASTLAALKKAKTPQQAARIFSQGYERPSVPNLPARERYAAQWAKQKPNEQGNTPISEGIAAGEGAVSSAASSVTSIPGAIGSAVTSATSFLSTWAVKGILLLAGAVLMIYGVMVAVRPRERALSIPLPV
jgi:hypothetical protein